jgi:hypothetical protein
MTPSAEQPAIVCGSSSSHRRSTSDSADPPWWAVKKTNATSAATPAWRRSEASTSATATSVSAAMLIAEKNFMTALGRGGSTVAPDGHIVARRGDGGQLIFGGRGGRDSKRHRR